MSAPPTAWLSNSAYNKLKGTYVNGDMDASQNLICRNGNLYMPADSSIYSPNNRIYFNETYYYTNFASNVHIFGTLQLDRSSVTYDVGYEIVDNIKPTLSTAVSNIATNTSNIATNTTNIATNTTNIATNTTNIATNTTNIATNTTNIATNTTDIATLNTSISGFSTSISTLTTKTTNMSYNSGTNTTSFSGNVSFPSASIDSGSISNTSFVSLNGAQTILGNKTFSNNIVLSASGNLNANGLLQSLGAYLRVDGDLRLNSGALTITQATLQKLQYLTTVSSNIQTQIDSCAKSASANTLSGVNTITGNIIANSQTITPTQLGYVSGATSNLQTQINGISTASYVTLATAQTISGAKIFSADLNGTATLTLNTSGVGLKALPVSTYNGGGSDFAEQVSLVNGIYGGSIQGGQIGVKDALNIGFYNNASFWPLMTSVNNSSYTTNTVTVWGNISPTNNIRLDTGSLLVNNQATTVTNAQLGYLSTLSGQLGQQVSGAFNTTSSYTTTTLYSLGSISLTAGVWNIVGQITIFGAGAFVQSGSTYGVSTTAAGFSDTDDPYMPSTSAVGYSTYQCVKVVAPTATTSYYLNLYARFSGGTMTRGALPNNFLKAVRIG